MIKIFIVEDDPLMSRFYERNFRLNNYEVELAINGEDAIAKLETMEVKPTLILLDIMMPKLSGLDVLRHIKKNPVLAAIPVVMLTNLAKDEYVDKALELGAVTYLIKSQYSAKEVVGKVSELIGAYGGSTPEVPDIKVPIKDAPRQTETASKESDTFNI